MLSQPLRFTNSGASSDVNFYRHQEMDCVGGGVFEKKGVEQRVGFMEEFEFGFEMDMTGVDDFSVDDLLDFPPETDEFETEIVVSGGGGVEEAEACVGVKLEDVGGEGGCCGFSPSEISVPAADVAELEWLSRFVEDSFSEFSLTYSGESPREKTKVGSETVARLFPRPLTKPRAKRSRSSGKSWTLSDTTTSSSSSGSTSSPLILDSALKLPPAKRQSRRLDTSASQSARRCSHCGAQKTPQWRTGPGGAKTLCNACGVRFKSGRLCPEYRPACSPTFSSELHSNQHRKVVEMRMKKIEKRLDQGNDGM